MATTQIKDVELKDFVRFSDLAEEPLSTLPPITDYEQVPLVTLDEAVEPLKSLVPDIEKMLNQIKEKCQEIKDSLTINESRSIMLYSIEWEPKEESFNLKLNRTLRHENREKLKPWLLYLKLFMKSLSKLPSIHCYVYRSISMDLSEEYFQGKIFLWWGFSLCTQSIDIIENEQNNNCNHIEHRTRFKIECRTAKDIRNHSYHQINDEILLLSGQSYKVLSNIDSGNGLHIIQIKEIDPYLNHNNERKSSISLSLNQQKPSINISIQNTSFYSVMLKLTGSSSSTYHNPHLEDLLSLSKTNSILDLSVRELIDQDMSIIIQRGIIDKKSIGLYLTGNNLTDQSLSILSDALYNNLTLVELDLSDNYLTDIGVKILMEVLSTNKTILKKLHLGLNNITDQGILYLSDMLKTNHSLTHLMLNKNHISNQGVHLLANALVVHNTSLEVLSLSSNSLITDPSIDSLIIMLQQNEILKELDITYCNISEMSLQRLRNKIHGKKDFKIYTNTNDKQCFLS